MKKKQAMAALLLFLMLSLAVPTSGYSQGVSRDSLTVAGFVNLGEKDDDYINVMTSTYLTSFLSKIFKNVPSFSAVEKSARANGFWDEREFNVLNAVAITEDFHSKYCVTGHYLVRKDKKIELSLYVYDVDNRSLKLERTYKTYSVRDLFGAADAMARDVLFLLIGNTVDLGKLKAGITEGTGRYRVFLNGNYSAEIGKGSDYESLFMAGQFVELSLLNSVTAKEVLKQKIKIEKDKTAEVFYSPRATLVVKSVKLGLEVLLNGLPVGRIDTGGELVLTNLDIMQPVMLELMENGQVIDRKTQELNEGEVNRVELSDEEETRSVHFPIQTGMMGWLQDSYLSAGMDFVFFKQFRLFFTAAGIIYNYQLGGLNFLPVLEFGAGYLFHFNRWMSISLNASATVFFIGDIPVNPQVRVEFEAWRFFVSAGARYSFKTEGGGLYPVFALGYRF